MSAPGVVSVPGVVSAPGVVSVPGSFWCLRQGWCRRQGRGGDNRGFHNKTQKFWVPSNFGSKVILGTK